MNMSTPLSLDFSVSSNGFSNVKPVRFGGLDVCRVSPHTIESTVFRRTCPPPVHRDIFFLQEEIVPFVEIWGCLRSIVGRTQKSVHEGTQS